MSESGFVFRLSVLLFYVLFYVLYVMKKVSGIIKTVRLRTIPLSESGVLLGIMLAAADYEINWLAAVFTVLTASFLQMVSNVSNELGDALSGTDTSERKGPKYPMQQGLLTVGDAKVLIWCLAALSVASGLAMIWFSFGTLLCLEAFMLMILGAAAIFAAMRYTLGPSPYGYKGLGDIYVFVFFGLVSVLGGYFIVSHTLYWRILLPAVAIGAFSTAVLNVNNIRDMKTDAATRITTPLKIGLKWARVYQTALIAAGWAAMTAYSCLRMYDLWHYLFVVTLPLFIIHLKGVWTREGKELDGMLPLLVMATFLFALCAGLGFVVFLF